MEPAYHLPEYFVTCYWSKVNSRNRQNKPQQNVSQQLVCFQQEQIEQASLKPKRRTKKQHASRA